MNLPNLNILNVVILRTSNTAFGSFNFLALNNKQLKKVGNFLPIFLFLSNFLFLSAYPARVLCIMMCFDLLLLFFLLSFLSFFL